MTESNNMLSPVLVWQVAPDHRYINIERDRCIAKVSQHSKCPLNITTNYVYLHWRAYVLTADDADDVEVFDDEDLFCVACNKLFKTEKA